MKIKKINFFDLGGYIIPSYIWAKYDLVPYYMYIIVYCWLTPKLPRIDLFGFVCIRLLYKSIFSTYTDFTNIMHSSTKLCNI